MLKHFQILLVSLVDEVYHHIEEGLPVGRIHNILMLNVLLEDAVRPLAELHAALALHAITHGDDDVEVVKRHRFLYAINV